MECCGKVICSGCIHAPIYDDKGNEVDNEKCPFCRTPPPYSHEKLIKCFEKRAELNDSGGINNLGGFYSEGRYGLSQNIAKAIELWNRAGELGSADAYYKLGNVYMNGYGVEIDMKKAIHYWELAAIGGNVDARHNLGCSEGRASNTDKALKHFMNAIEGGYAASLGIIKLMYKEGEATKEDYTNALRSYQAYLDEIKSDQRDKAASSNDRYKYYESAV